MLNDSEIKGACSFPLFYKLPPENIVRLKNIIETYDGMIGEIRTLNAELGEIAIFALVDTKELAERVIKSLSEKLDIKEIPVPKDLSGDWLLADSLK